MAEETRGRTYIISHSALDLVSTLNHYERLRQDRDVTILVSGTRENWLFLDSLRLPNGALRLLEYTSLGKLNRRHIRCAISLLKSDRDMLARVAEEVTADPTAEMIFHSYDNDPYAAYLIARVARTHAVTLIDTLGLPPRRLAWYKLLTGTGLRNTAYVALIESVFGRLFFLSGTVSYPVLSFDLDDVDIARRPRSEGGTVETLSSYIHPLRVGPKAALLLYQDCFGVSEAHHVAVYRAVLDRLVTEGWEVIAKVHPQSQEPEFFEEFSVRSIPSFVPFEFIDLSGIRVVVGLAGAALLSTGNVPAVSLVKAMYEEDSDYYRTAMTQLGQRQHIHFAHSVGGLAHFTRHL